MPKYRTKSILVEARRLKNSMEILVPDGLARGKPGDWLVTRAPNDKIICTHEQFVSTYEPVDDAARLEIYKVIK